MNDRKRQLANARRLESLKNWKLGKTLQAKQIKDSIQNLDSGCGFQNKKIRFDSDYLEDESASKCKDAEKNQTEKPSLFMPSESEEEDNEMDDGERFQLKSQFQGPKGQQLFEMSSHFADDRFRLDERFQEPDEPYESDAPVEEESESTEKRTVIDEKKKNFEILEQVLGFQVSKKEFDIEASSARKKKHMRFDPESEDASKYLKKIETTEHILSEQKCNKKIKKAKSPPPPVKEPEVSTDRYFQVSSDLKDILGKSSGFSLSNHFGFSHDVNDIKNDEKQDTENNTSSLQTVENLNKVIHERNSSDEITSSQNTGLKRNYFFFQPNDSRLQVGVDFFRRKKSMDEIHEEWMNKRDAIIEILHKKRKLAVRSANPKVLKGTTTKQRNFNYGRK